MGLLPGRDKLKVFMKKGLPLVFAVAWAPMVWMLLAAVLGSTMERLIGSWQVTVVVLALTTLLVTIGLNLMFRRYGLKIFGEAGS